MRSDLRDHIEGDRVAESFVLVFFIFKERLRALGKILLTFDAGTAGRLVSRDNNALDFGDIVDRLHGDHHLRSTAVGAGDDAFVIGDGFWIDFGDHQWHVVEHAMVAAFVDDDAVPFHGPWHEFSGNLIGGRTNHDIDIVEGVWFQ